MGFWSNRIKNTEIIANKLGISEEKLRELKNGEREVSGETMNKLLTTINETNNAEVEIKKTDVLKWYEENKILDKMKEFGYANYKDLGKAIGISYSSVSQLACGTMNRTNTTGIKLYNFFQNEFNKKPLKKSKSKPIKLDIDDRGYMRNKLTNEECEAIIKWYEETDLLEEIKNSKYKSYNTVSEVLGIATNTISQLRTRKMNYLSNTGIKIYKLLTETETPTLSTEKTTLSNETTVDNTNILEPTENTLETELKPAEEIVKNDEDIWNWYNITDLKAERRKFGYSINKFMSSLNLSYDQFRDYENKRYKTVNDTLARIYYFLHNEKNRLPELRGETGVYENNRFTISIGNNTIKNELILSNEVAIEELQKKCDKLIKENERLLRQISMYEKLIERL